MMQKAVNLRAWSRQEIDSQTPNSRRDLHVLVVLHWKTEHVEISFYLQARLKEVERNSDGPGELAKL